MSTNTNATAGRDSERRHLSAVAYAGPRDPGAERDVLARLTDEIDRSSADLRAGSPWRAWLAARSRVLHTAAGLQAIRATARHDDDGEVA
jgi:hypothetical protein